jgi:hypothetical protein
MRAFLAGGLPVDQEESIARHLDGCLRCERLAATLSDDEPTRRFARYRASAVAVNSPDVDDLCRQVYALGMLSMGMDNSVSVPKNRIRSAATNSLEECRGSDWFARGIEIAEEQPGQPRLKRLGRYEVLRRLGAGSFGIVYLA